jgi:hypothetical protein
LNEVAIISAAPQPSVPFKNEESAPRNRMTDQKNPAAGSRRGF